LSSTTSRENELHSFVKLAIGYLGIMAGFAVLGLIFYETGAREGPAITSVPPFYPYDVYLISVVFFWTLIALSLVGLFALVKNLRIGAYFAFESLPSTSEISRAYGYDTEKYCPTCYRKFKRHATRKRIGDHRHYPIFAVCNPIGKNPGNVWEISTKAHYGNEHFAIFPEDLVARIINFASQENDWVLDPFMGRGTTGIVCALTGRNFAGIDLYSENVRTAKKNIDDAMNGRYDKKLVESVAKQLDFMKLLQTRFGYTLEKYMLADGTLV